MPTFSKNSKIIGRPRKPVQETPEEKREKAKLNMRERRILEDIDKEGVPVMNYMFPVGDTGAAFNRLLETFMGFSFKEGLTSESFGRLFSCENGGVSARRVIDTYGMGVIGMRVVIQLLDHVLKQLHPLLELNATNRKNDILRDNFARFVQMQELMRIEEVAEVAKAISLLKTDSERSCCHETHKGPRLPISPSDLSDESINTACGKHAMCRECNDGDDEGETLLCIHCNLSVKDCLQRMRLVLIKVSTSTLGNAHISPIDFMISKVNKQSGITGEMAKKLAGGELIKKRSGAGNFVCHPKNGTGQGAKV